MTPREDAGAPPWLMWLPGQCPKGGLHGHTGFPREVITGTTLPGKASARSPCAPYRDCSGQGKRVALWPCVLGGELRLSFS